MHLALCVLGVPPVPLHEVIGVFSTVHIWPLSTPLSKKYRNASRYDWRELEEEHRSDEEEERTPEMLPDGYEQPPITGTSAPPTQAKSGR